jgi:prolyl 4-hydroxylase
MHKDRIATHHQSLIIIVDKKVSEDWPLHIIDHQGTPHDIYADPGEMILYESAVCEHGRPETFRGEYFRNMFAHWTLDDWTYTG